MQGQALTANFYMAWTGETVRIEKQYDFESSSQMTYIGGLCQDRAEATNPTEEHQSAVPGIREAVA